MLSSDCNNFFNSSQISSELLVNSKWLSCVSDILYPMTGIALSSFLVHWIIFLFFWMLLVTISNWQMFYFWTSRHRNILPHFKSHPSTKGPWVVAMYFAKVAQDLQLAPPVFTSTGTDEHEQKHKHKHVHVFGVIWTLVWTITIRHFHKPDKSPLTIHWITWSGW